MTTFMPGRYTKSMQRPSCSELGALPLFGGIPEESLQRLIEKVDVVHVDPGATVFAEGETARSLYVLVGGGLDVVKAGVDGEVYLGGIAPGECFGEMSFIDMQPRSATVRVRLPSVLWVWPYQAIHERYCKDQKCAMLLVMNIARELSRRLRRADELLSRREPATRPPGPSVAGRVDGHVDGHAGGEAGGEAGGSAGAPTGTAR
jgi:CRP-like cAMP-binding protein